MSFSDSRFAFDASVRHIDADGRLHVLKSHLSKSTVSPYYGKEIPGFESLGLKPDKIYHLFRDPVELERGAASFARLPILSEHVPITVDAPRPDLVIGAVGSDVAFKNPYLDADLCFWDSTAIAGIETDKVRELSCAYRYVPVMEPGKFNGQAYDGRMTEINGNHLALVENGRAGSDVVVADNNPFKKDLKMKMTKLGKALFYAICAASPVLAADSALPAMVGKADKKNFKRDDIRAELLALDAMLDSNKLDNIIDAILDVEQDPNPVESPADVAEDDESPAGKLRALLAGKVDDETITAACALMTPAAAADEFLEEKIDKKRATDEFPPKDDDKKEDKGMKKEEVDAAMDSLRKELKEAEEARRDVRPVVGDVLGMDSAAEVYGFALDHLKADRKDVEGVPALRALFKLAAAGKASAPVPRIALDSDGLEKQFPGVARFRNV